MKSIAPSQYFSASMLEGMAEYYSAELSEKIHRGQKDNALKGRNNGGRIPLGFKLGADKKLEINPATAPIVQEIFKRYAGEGNRPGHCERSEQPRAENVTGL